MAACVAIGFLLDKFLGTTPWLVLAGAFTGLACMIARLVFISNQGRV